MIYSFSTFKQPPIGSYDLNRSVAPGKLTCYSAAKSSQAIGYQIQIADFGSSDFGGKPQLLAAESLKSLRRGGDIRRSSFIFSM